MRRGFTLLEMLVASVVLATGAVVAMQCITASVAASVDLGYRSQAQRLAASQLARASAGDLPTLPATGQEQRGAITYDWRVEQRSVATGLRQLTCSVQWTRGEKTQRFQLQRLAAQRGNAP